MKKKLLAVALAATMVVSSAITSMAESLTGTAWWTGSQTGTNYTLTGDGSLTLQVEVKEGDAEGGNVAFSVEATTGTYYLTTGSDGNIWTADSSNNNAPVDGATITKNPFADAGDTAAGSAEVGHTYEVVITRSGNDFTVAYNDVTSGTQLYDMAVTGLALDNEVAVHVMAQLGTMEVTQKEGAATTVTTTNTDTTTGTSTDTDSDGDTDTSTDTDSDNDTDTSTNTTNTSGTTTTTTTNGTTAPATGDTATTAAVLVVMIAAAGAVVVLKRKKVSE